MWSITTLCIFLVLCLQGCCETTSVRLHASVAVVASQSLLVQHRNGHRQQQQPGSSSLVASTTSSSSSAVTSIPVAMRKEKVLKWIPDGMKNALASGFATILVKLILQPFDTIKTIQQIQTVEQSVLVTAQTIFKQRGMLGLWSGTLVSAVCAAPASAVYFGVFSSVKKRLAAILPSHLRFLAVGIGAMVGNSLAAVLRVPYEVYKQRLQAGMHADLLSAVTHSWKTEGFIGLFAGGKLASQIIRDVPYAIIGAITYDILQRLVTKKRLEAEAEGKNTKSVGQFQDAICGALAGGIGTYLTTPMDVIKTRLMITDKYSSVPDAIQRILREDGFSTFFAGVQSRLLHKIPANGLFFLFYEAFRYMLGAVEYRSEQ